MLTPAQFRALALSLPDVVEGAHQGHADFRSGGRILASLPGEATGMVRVSPDRQRELVRAHAGAFAPANGAWGRAGCTMVDLAAANREVVLLALTDAWQQAQARPAARRAPKADGKAKRKAGPKPPSR